MFSFFNKKTDKKVVGCKEVKDETSSPRETSPRVESESDKDGKKSDDVDQTLVEKDHIDRKIEKDEIIPTSTSAEMKILDSDQVNIDNDIGIILQSTEDKNENEDVIETIVDEKVGVEETHDTVISDCITSNIINENEDKIESECVEQTIIDQTVAEEETLDAVNSISVINDIVSEISDPKGGDVDPIGGDLDPIVKSVNLAITEAERALLNSQEEKVHRQIYSYRYDNYQYRYMCVY